MSYWLEDGSGEWLGDLATNVGIGELREAGSPSLVEFLDAGEADDGLIEKIVNETRELPDVSYLAEMIDGAEPPVCITDGCGDVEDTELD